jgi:hypothetical protein
MKVSESMVWIRDSVISNDGKFSSIYKFHKFTLSNITIKISNVFLVLFIISVLFKRCSYLLFLSHFLARISDKWLLICYDYLQLDQHRQATEYVSLGAGPFRP